MTHNELIAWLFDGSQSGKVGEDRIIRKFTSYIHRSFYNIPWVSEIINEYINDVNTYSKPGEYMLFLKYLIQKNGITRKQMTSIFPKKQKTIIEKATI